jgi:hypothetical protein
VSQFDTCQSLCACSSSACTIAGWQWPSAVTATPLAKSMYMPAILVPHARAFAAHGMNARGA